MALAVVGTPTAGGNQVFAGTIASAAQTHTAGNALVALFTSGTTAMTSVANTAGDTWTEAVSARADASNNNKTRVFYVNSTAGAVNDIVTGTRSTSGTYNAVVVYEISGSGGFDTANNGNSTGTAIATGSLTITGASDIIIAMACMVAAGSPVAGAGYSGFTNFAITGDANKYYSHEYKVVTASEAASMSEAGGPVWCIGAVALKVATAAAGSLFRPSALAGLGAGGKFFQNPLNYPVVHG